MKKNNSKVINEIYSSLDTQFVVLSNEFLIGYRSFLLYQALKKLQEEKFHLFCISYHSNTLSLLNHLEKSILQLTKLFETNRSDFNTDRLLCNLQTHKTLILKKHNNLHCEIYEKELQNIYSTRDKLQPALKDIKKLRDEVLAHIDKTVLDQSQVKSYFPNDKKIEELYSLIKSIIELYYHYFEGTSVRYPFYQLDDFHLTTNYIEKGIQYDINTKIREVIYPNKTSIYEQLDEFLASQNILEKIDNKVIFMLFNLSNDFIQNGDDHRALTYLIKTKELCQLHHFNGLLEMIQQRIELIHERLEFES